MKYHSVEAYIYGAAGGQHDHALRLALKYQPAQVVAQGWMLYFQLISCRCVIGKGQAKQRGYSLSTRKNSKNERTAVIFFIIVLDEYVPITPGRIS